MTSNKYYVLRKGCLERTFRNFRGLVEYFRNTPPAEETNFVVIYGQSAKVKLQVTATLDWEADR